MSKKKRAILIITATIVLVIIIAVIYLCHKDWKDDRGWNVDYNENTDLNGVEAMTCECSRDTRIEYSYSLSSGSIELKVARDSEGKDIVRSVQIAESVNGEITFDNKTPETYYIFETADEETKASGTVEVFVRKSRWKQIVEDRQGAKELQELQEKYQNK